MPKLITGMSPRAAAFAPALWTAVTAATDGGVLDVLVSVTAGASQAANTTHAIMTLELRTPVRVFVPWREAIIWTPNDLRDADLGTAEGNRQYCPGWLPDAVTTSRHRGLSAASLHVESQVPHRFVAAMKATFVAIAALTVACSDASGPGEL